MGYLDFNLNGAKDRPGKDWQRRAGKEILRDGWRGRSTENFVVVDLDGNESISVQELIARFERTNRERITTILETPSGGRHYWFSGTTRNQQRNGWDVRGIGGYECIPPSPGYRFVTPEVPIEYLRPFPPEILKDSKCPQKCTTIVREARRYIMGIFAVSGQRGHNATFKACCKLRDEGLSEVEALAEMIVWNETNSSPPWSTKELLYKVQSAYSKGKT